MNYYNLNLNTTNSYTLKNTSYPQDKNNLKQKNSHKINKSALLGSAAGTLIPSILILSKQQNTSGIINKFKKVDFSDLKLLLTIASGSILGGLAGGIIGAKGKDTSSKLKEANFQIISNVLAPVTLIKSFKKINDRLTANSSNKIKKLASSVNVLAGIGIGVPFGSFVANKINNKFNKDNTTYKRKLTIKDFLVHIDDLPTALAISGVANVDKMLPFLLISRGYEAGNKTNSTKK